MSYRLVDLNHPFGDGTLTCPGLPAPVVKPHLTREASRDVYAEGTEFELDVITMIGNTGTYLDSPFHRYADGTDLSGLPLESLVDLPAVVVRHDVFVGRGIGAADFTGLEIAGRAVLLDTGWDVHFGKDAYGVDAPFLSADGAEYLAAHGAALVGIDSVNIDDTQSGGTRPAHSILLANGIPIVEHLTGLAGLPTTGALFTSVPPRVRDFGTFPVRAFAKVP